MLGEVLTVLNIIKGVMDIWDRVKPTSTVESARQVTQQVEQQAGTQDAAAVIHTLKGQAQQYLAPVEADELLADVKYRWILEVLKTNLRQRGWKVLEEPEFLLVLEKITSLGQLSTGFYLMGFVAGPPTAQGVDREFERWTHWLGSQSGQPNGLLVYVYDTLTGVSPQHIVEKHRRKLWKYEALGGYLDLSRVTLDVHRGALEKYSQPYGGMTVWEAETQEVLRGVHEEYIRISGYFR